VIEKIAQIKNLLRGQKRFRYLLLFTVGVNSALRVSDLLKLQSGDFVDAQGQLRARFTLTEEKRGKRNEVTINDSIKEAFSEYLLAYPTIADSPQNYVFFNSKRSGFAKPLGRGQAHQFMKAICADVALSGNSGTHTLRKTWGYHARLAGVPIELIMHKFKHNNLAYTKRYLGITDDELEAVVRRLNL
jgi:integrase